MALDGGGQAVEIGAQALEARSAGEADLVHVEPAVDLDLQAVPPGGRVGVAPDQLGALVGVVQLDRVAQRAQLRGDETGEGRVAGAAVAVAQDEVRTKGGAVGRGLVAHRRHGMAVDVPGLAEAAVGAVQEFAQGGVIGAPAGLDPVLDLGDAQLAVVDLAQAAQPAPDQPDAAPRLVAGPRDLRPGPLDHLAVQVLQRPVGIDVAAREEGVEQRRAQRHNAGVEGLDVAVLGLAQDLAVDPMVEVGRVVAATVRAVEDQGNGDLGGTLDSNHDGGPAGAAPGFCAASRSLPRSSSMCRRR